MIGRGINNNSLYTKIISEYSVKKRDIVIVSEQDNSIRRNVPKPQRIPKSKPSLRHQYHLHPFWVEP